MQTGKPAQVERTMFGAPIVFTEQLPHEFEEDGEMGIIFEKPRPEAPKIHHRGCARCKTYSVMNKCGYTLASEDDVKELESKE